MPMRVVHCRAMKFATGRSWMLVSRRHRTVVAVAIIQSVIYVPVEISRPMEPRARADEHAAREPFRTIIPIGSAIVRRNLIVSIGANGRRADLYRNLSWRTRTRGEKQAHNNRQHCCILQCSHCFTSIHLRSHAATMVVQRIRHASEIKVNSVRYRTYRRFHITDLRLGTTSEAV